MTQYRDDLDAARARIETLEARIREREAALDARDAELAELRAELSRLRRGQAAAADVGVDHGRDAAESAAGQRALLVALAACGFTLLAGYALVRPTTCRLASVNPRSNVPHMPAQLARLPTIDVEDPDPVVRLFPNTADPDTIDGDSDGDFDRGAAIRKLTAAATEAQACTREGDTRGRARVKVTFEPNGEVSLVELDPSLVRTPVGTCVLKVFAKVHVPPFDGDSVTVSKKIYLR